MQNFLKKGVAERILAQMVAEDEADGLGSGKRPAYRAGVGRGWEPVGEILGGRGGVRLEDDWMRDKGMGEGLEDDWMRDKGMGENVRQAEAMTNIPLYEGPPHKQRYLRFDGDPAAASGGVSVGSESCGALLAQV